MLKEKNGVVLMKIDDYRHCMTNLFSDTTKFLSVNNDSSLTQLTNLQTYLRTLLNRNEVTEFDI